jgi:hypothetical protein
VGGGAPDGGSKRYFRTWGLLEYPLGAKKTVLITAPETQSQHSGLESIYCDRGECLRRGATPAWINS